MLGRAIASLLGTGSIFKTSFGFHFVIARSPGQMINFAMLAIIAFHGLSRRAFGFIRLHR